MGDRPDVYFEGQRRSSPSYCSAKCWNLRARQPNVERDPGAARSKPKMARLIRENGNEDGLDATSLSKGEAGEIACAYVPEKKFRSMALCWTGRAQWTSP